MDQARLIQVVTDKVLQALSNQLPPVYLVGNKVEALAGNLQDQGQRVLRQLPEEGQVRDGAIFVAEISSCKSLFRLAQLVAINPLEEAVVSTLLEGAPLYLKLTAPDPANPKLGNKLAQAKKDLQAYGACFVEGDFLPGSPLAKGLQAGQPSPQVGQAGKKQVITLDSVKKDFDAGKLDVFVLNRHMILTALAKDFLREKNIPLVKE